MPKKYYYLLFFSLAATILSCIVYFFLTSAKPPSLDKRNFFTLSARVPEYLIEPVNTRNIIEPQNVNYPHVSLSPATYLYQVINFFQYWELSKKKYDNLFFASKQIAEIITFDKEVSWQGQLASYRNFIGKEMKENLRINDPRLRLKQFIDLNKQVMGHEKRLREILSASNKTETEKKILGTVLDKTFELILFEIRPHLPPLKKGNITYHLIDPLFDREYGTYDAQFVKDDISIGKLRTVGIDGRTNFLHIPLDEQTRPQKLSWVRDSDLNNILFYRSAVEAPYEGLSTITEFSYHFKQEAKIILKHFYREKKDPAEVQQEQLFYEIVYPHAQPKTINRIILTPRSDVIDSRFQIEVEILHQALDDHKNELPELTFTYHPLIETEPLLLLTKKTTNSAGEPIASIKRIDNSHYKLQISNLSFFNGRQIKYNLKHGWSIDENTKVLYYRPGILLGKLVTIFSFFSIFFALCLITRKPLDTRILRFIGSMVGISQKFIKSLSLITDKIFYHIRLWTFILGTLLMLGETFLHTESSDSLIFITIIFWVITAIGYGLEARFSFLLSFIFFITSAVFLIAKPMTVDNYNADKISSFEVVADKFAIWTVVFMIVTMVSILLEFKDSKKKRSLSISILQFINDWKTFIARISIIHSSLKKIAGFVAPRSLKLKDITIYLARSTLFVLISILLYIGITNYNKHQKFQGIQPKILKHEPTIVYRSTKVIIWGNNFDMSGFDDDIKLKSQYGEIREDFWSDEKIIFTVPLEWSDGEIRLWIEKPAKFEGKRIVTKSQPITIILIPTTQKFSAEDDKFFEQLKSLDDETLKINGYE